MQGGGERLRLYFLVSELEVGLFLPPPLYFRNVHRHVCEHSANVFSFSLLSILFQLFSIANNGSRIVAVRSVYSRMQGVKCLHE